MVEGKDRPDKVILMTDWDDGMYREIFDSMVQYLKDRRDSDPDFDIGTLRELIMNEYVKQGNDWVGKGPVQQIRESATVAAYEHYLAQWEAEMKS
ncbi:MAG: hypothetical protein ACMUIG_03850 [Thermoplasmatota archaeon]